MDWRRLRRALEQHSAAAVCVGRRHCLGLSDLERLVQQISRMPPEAWSDFRGSPLSTLPSITIGPPVDRDSSGRLSDRVGAGGGPEPDREDVRSCVSTRRRGGASSNPAPGSRGCRRASGHRGVPKPGRRRLPGVPRMARVPRPARRWSMELPSLCTESATSHLGPHGSPRLLPRPGRLEPTHARGATTPGGGSLEVGRTGHDRAAPLDVRRGSVSPRPRAAWLERTSSPSSRFQWRPQHQGSDRDHASSKRVPCSRGSPRSRALEPLRSPGN
jgi:hypothetical protein